MRPIPILVFMTPILDEANSGNSFITFDFARVRSSFQASIEIQVARRQQL